MEVLCALSHFIKTMEINVLHAGQFCMPCFFSKLIFLNIIRVANSLEPDQA